MKLKVLIIISLYLTIPIFSIACSKVQNDKLQSTKETRKVIIDTDTGADDASALILAAKSGKLDILGVTTLVGNVGLDQSTKNALSALEIAGYSAPVYQGSSENCKGKKIKAKSVFGSDGMGDADLIKTTSKAEPENAIDFILNTVKQNPNDVEIIRH